MLRFLLILIFLFICADQAFSQLYSGRKGGMNFFVEVNENAAHVEIFSIHHETYLVKKQNEEFLKPVYSGDTAFAGKENHLIKRGNKYRLVYIPWQEAKIYGIKLKSCTNDSRTVFRGTAYPFEVRAMDEKPEVSISDSNSRTASPTILTNASESSVDQKRSEVSVSDSIYTVKAGLSAESIITRQIKKTTMLHFSLNSISLNLRQPTVSQDHFVSNSNDFLIETSAREPEYLIEKNPFMKAEIQNLSRAEEGNKQFIQKVKLKNSISPEQGALIQASPKGFTSSSFTLTMLSLVIATEIGAVMLLAYWIFKSNSLSF